MPVDQLQRQLCKCQILLNLVVYSVRSWHICKEKQCGLIRGQVKRGMGGGAGWLKLLKKENLQQTFFQMLKKALKSCKK